MARGSLVGDAYIRIHANTEAMRRELHKQAKGDADSYMQAFDEEVQHTVESKLAGSRKKLADALVHEDFSKFGDQFDGVAQKVRSVEDEINHLVATNQISLKQAREMRDALDKWKVNAKFIEDMGKARTEAGKLNNVFDDSVKHAEAWAKSMEKADTSAMRNEIQKLTGSLNKSNNEYDKEKAHAAAWAKDVEHAVAAQAKAWESYGKNLIAGAKKHDPFVKAMQASVSKMKETEGWLGKIGKVADQIGPKVGKAFGAGSRNNFLNVVGNLVGGLTGGIVDALMLIPRTIPKVMDWLGTLRDGFSAVITTIQDAEHSVVGITTALGQMVLSNINWQGIAIAVAAVIGGILAIGVAAAAIGVALNLAAAAVSVLAGMFLSLASAAAFAIAGGLLPLVPALLAVAPALAVVIGLMQDFSKTAKQQPKYVKDLKAAWGETGKALTVAKESFGKAIATIFPILASFWNPLIKSTGAAMGQVGQAFGKAISSPGMKGFMQAFTDKLPGIFKSLGLGVNSLITGLIAFFAPILPFAQRLADAFGQITKKFSDWAASAAGQKAITDFMDKAWQAASSLWTIIVNLATAIGTLFGAGQQNGQGFLDWLAALTKQFSDWLQSAQGQTALKQFFEDAKTSAQHLWDLVKTVFAFFDQLDTSASRDELNLLIDSATTVIGVFGDIVIAGGNMVLALLPIFKGLALSVAIAFAAIVNAAAIAFGAIPGPIGESFRAAAAKSDAFVAQVNRDFNNIKADITVAVDTAQAMRNVGNLKAAMNGLTDKTVVVTQETHFVVKTTSTGGGRVTAGGSTKGAAGMLLTGPTNILAGEAGPEALVPLDRSLALVDPAVRALSAIAQGKTRFASGGTVGTGKTINVAEGAIVVQTTQANPHGVALSVLDRLTAAAV